MHNSALVAIALFLSDYSQDLYFFIENEEIANLEELTKTENWFFNATTIGDYYDYTDDLDGFIDGVDPEVSANYCTSDPSPWNNLGFTVKRVHCSRYDATTRKFEEPQDFPTFFTDKFHPNNPKDFGKMEALWGEVTTNYCPEQCTTDSVHFTRAHLCNPALCNFHKITKNGDT